MKLFLSFALALSLPICTFAATVTENLSDAIKKKEVAIEAIDVNGKFMGEAVKITVNNQTRSGLELTVDAGMMLKSLYPNMQELVLVGGETVTVRSNGKSEVTVAVFCANGPKPAPIASLPYTYQGMAKDTLIKILHFIKEHSLNDYLGQSAVWVATNHNPINNVYDNKRDALSKQLIDVVASATNHAKPQYYAMNAENGAPAGPSFIPQTEKIFVPFETELKVSGMLTVKLLDEKGKVVKTLMEHKSYAAGKQSFISELAPNGIKTGKYTMRLTNAKDVVKDVEVQVYKYADRE